MFPQTLPLTDFKKEYKFLWFIDAPSSEDYYPEGGSSVEENWALYHMQEATLGNIVYCGYVSQLAEQVNLPDDEFEIEQMKHGPVTYEIPKSVKLQNITVTYLEDSFNSVYNFHKTWFNMIRGGTGVYFNPPCELCARARYIEFEDTLTAEEYIAYKNVVVSTLERLPNAILPNALSSKLDSLKPEIPLGAKPTGITTYPRIYPTRISRTAANKGGTGLHKVTVTYSRIPEFKKNHSNLQMLDADGEHWHDVK